MGERGQMNIRNQPSISIAIPVYNEEAVVQELLRRTRAVLDRMPGGPHQIVLVDDGSSDRTSELLEGAVKKDPGLVVVELSRNFGHQTALGAALDYVSGDVAILMDADLQDPPEAIPILVAAYKKGYDVVYVQRVNRKEAWWLRACYYLFYRLLAALSSIRLPLDAGDFGLMSRRVIREIRRMPEHHRYIRGMRTWVGFRQVGVPIERAPRRAGRTKYSPLRLLKLASDGIFCFLHRSPAGRGDIRGRCHWPFFTLFYLCAVCEILVTRTTGFHSVSPGNYVSFWRESVFSGNHWGVRGANLRRSEGASALRCPQSHGSTRSRKQCCNSVH